MSHGKVLEGKPPLYTALIQSFPRALAAIGEHTAKHATIDGHHWHGWKEVPEGFKVYSEAMIRHLLAEDVADMGAVQLAEKVVATCWNDIARLEHLLADLED